MEIIKDKDPIWDVDNFDVVLVGTSIYNQLNGGFQSKIRFKFPEVEIKNKETKYGDMSKFGTRLTIYGKPTVSLLYFSASQYHNKDTVDYKALENCLLTANAEFKGQRVITTLLGASQFDGNGDRDKCLSLIENTTKDLDLVVYDYVQKKRRDELTEQRKYLSSLQYTNPEKYKQLKSVFDIYLKKLYLNG